MTNDIIVTHQLSKNFGRFPAVQSLELRVPAGGIYGFLGPNGAGKSTTIRMLLGLMQPSAGEVAIFGRSLRSDRLEILRQVGSLVEAPSYYGHLSAYENLDLSRRIRRLPASEVDRVLEIVRLSEARAKRVSQFSMGMKQRLGIAHALLGSPSLLILDEPTNGLDPAGIHEMRDLVRSLPVESVATVLVSSHLLSEVELIATHVGIVHQGKLLFQGSLDALKAQNGSEIVLDARPKEDALRFLAGQGYALEARNGHLRLRGSRLNEAALNRLLVTSGFEVYHLSRQQGTLEDIFLAVTEKGTAA